MPTELCPSVPFPQDSDGSVNRPELRGSTLEETMYLPMLTSERSARV